MGWLIDPDDRSVLVFQPQQQPELCYGQAALQVLDKVELNLTIDQVLGWLKMK